jgi:hypothetical protein
MREYGKERFRKKKIRNGKNKGNIKERTEINKEKEQWYLRNKMKEKEELKKKERKKKKEIA